MTPRPFESVEILPSTSPASATWGRWNGGWTSVDTGAGALSARTDPGVRIDEDQEYEAAIWGGVGPDGTPRIDGVVFDSAREVSLPMLPAPMCPRTDYAVDDELILVCGGKDVGGQWLDDGALYDRSLGDWTVLPPSGLAGGLAATANGLVVVRDEITGIGIAARPVWGDGTVGWATASVAPLPPSVRYTLLSLDDGRVLVIGEAADGTTTAVVNEDVLACHQAPGLTRMAGTGRAGCRQASAGWMGRCASGPRSRTWAWS